MATDLSVFDIDTVLATAQRIHEIQDYTYMFHSYNGPVTKKRRLRVYISSALTTGDDLAGNYNRALDSFYRLLKLKFAPLLPHLSAAATEAVVEERESAHGTVISRVVAELGGTPRDTTYEDWIELDKALVEGCDCLLRLPEASRGADIEVRHALEQGIAVFYSEEALIEYRASLDCMYTIN